LDFRASRAFKDKVYRVFRATRAFREFKVKEFKEFKEFLDHLRVLAIKDLRVHRDPSVPQEASVPLAVSVTKD
jgi:hypothetical protein